MKDEDNGYAFKKPIPQGTARKILREPIQKGKVLKGENL
jgi:hypothetical protein